MLLSAADHRVSAVRLFSCFAGCGDLRPAPETCPRRITEGPNHGAKTIANGITVQRMTAGMWGLNVAELPPSHIVLTTPESRQYVLVAR